LHSARTEFHGFSITILSRFSAERIPLVGAKRTSRVRLSRPGQSLVIQTMKARSDLRSWSRHGVFHRDIELMAQMPFSASSRWRDLNG
jgi:hypothetical protein